MSKKRNRNQKAQTADPDTGCTVLEMQDPEGVAQSPESGENGEERVPAGAVEDPSLHAQPSNDQPSDQLSEQPSDQPSEPPPDQSSEPPDSAEQSPEQPTESASQTPESSEQTAEPQSEAAEVENEVAPSTPADPGDNPDPKDPPPAAELTEQEELAALRAQIAELKTQVGTKAKTNSGSQARPNVKYMLLEQPPKWSGTPQVAQLQQIIFDPERNGGKTELTEPEIFEIVKNGAADGVLKTKQSPVRILQYYRAQLIADDCIRVV